MFQKIVKNNSERKSTEMKTMWKDNTPSGNITSKQNPVNKNFLQIQKKDSFLWFLGIAQFILEEWYDASADLGSFQNIGNLENLRVRLGLPNILATQFPTFVKSQKIPNEKGRSSEAIIFHGKSGEVNRISSQIALWLPEKYPITFFQRIPQLIHKTYGKKGGLFGNFYSCWFHLFWISLETILLKLTYIINTFVLLNKLSA